MNDEGFVGVERVDRGRITYLTLNRPQNGNSLSIATIDALHAHLMDLRGAKSTAVIVLAGAGRSIFCAGHDLKEMDPSNLESSKAVTARCSAMMLLFRDQPQIIIAKVEGVASAAGCQLVASADLAIASRDARFATPGVNIGLWCGTPMVALSRSVLPKHAMHMLTTGKLVDAEHAFNIGLVNQIVEPIQLDAAVDKLALDIASKSTYTVAIGKQAFYRQIQMPVAEAYEYASEVGARNSAHADAREGIAAFLAKREARWIGR